MVAAELTVDRQLKAAPDWQLAVEDLRPVQKLVHLVFRMTSEHEDAIAAELVKMRRSAYEERMNEIGKLFGVSPDVRLTSGPQLSHLFLNSQRDAAAIVNTYNKALVNAIKEIAGRFPKANRNTYAKHLNIWDTIRGEWKARQIAITATIDARNYALQEFMKGNPNAKMQVQLVPGPSVCDICKDLIARGPVSPDMAFSHPAPLHIGCIHSWEPVKLKLVGDKADLWFGDQVVT